ncbi:MAG: acetyl-CoA carboxylase biotin carboxyl carrier protein [Rhodospirillaceae bacterium]|nr:acetyl-CoA carboxylase biotin carboxyl carrier protein [Rhodospirillaceae bacterium]
MKLNKPKSAPAKPAKETSATSLDSDLVKRLAAILNETGLTEIEYDAGGVRVRVAKSAHHTVMASAPTMAMMAPAAPVAAAPQPAVPSTLAAAPAASDAANHPGAVKSPMVGVAYLSPEPGKPPFVKPGDSVAEGQTLLLIEAMKTYNPVKAPKAGKVARIIVADTAPVEYGEPLMIIE